MAGQDTEGAHVGPAQRGTSERGTTERGTTSSTGSQGANSASSEQVKMGLTSPKPTTLPVPCQNRPASLPWKKAGPDVGRLATNSQSMVSLYEKVRSRVSISEGELHGRISDELGSIGRLADMPESRDKVGIQLAWTRIQTLFQAALVLAHEYKHAEEVLERGFTSTEGAPFLTYSQYLVLRWQNEFDAFQFQTTVAKEITKADPSLLACLTQVIEGDQIFESFLADREASRIRYDVIEFYKIDDLGRQYRTASETRSSNIFGEETKRKVVTFLKSSRWRDYTARWNGYLSDFNLKAAE